MKLLDYAIQSIATKPLPVVKAKEKEMDIPTYPIDRDSVVKRGLINMRGQVKSIQGELEWTQRQLVEFEDDPLYAKRIPEFKRRVANLTDVLRVLAIYIELGEEEQRRLRAQPTLFAESPGAP